MKVTNKHRLLQKTIFLNYAQKREKATNYRKKYSQLKPNEYRNFDPSRDLQLGSNSFTSVFCSNELFYLIFSRLHCLKGH